MGHDPGKGKRAIVVTTGAIGAFGCVDTSAGG